MKKTYPRVRVVYDRGENGYWYVIFIRDASAEVLARDFRAYCAAEDWDEPTTFLGPSYDLALDKASKMLTWDPKLTWS